ncbi:Fur family transcriptional regulator, peroxide stress response regulator [Thermosyntropha lipolytica DSM 11003]|uniref:Fur family transcriptional regulator, peroxide stress response regulator n=1 Tax=Thermosyntropha lipolytica DSM 11003 TaxID=1123382 RepID=A0A1M5PUG3_9FIRM|nr:Fur family transcriptional regulator [Thermosyntropha lipolytica]SHH05494.1 Fur family transcriptional regulator, peroxide stress response regulator [Thermosyntropha lipolytica DSM 11003]
MQQKKVEQLLKQHDIKPSYHRIKILSYLLEKKNHPTADMIYQELVKEIPTLSKTTVYNTLNLFVEKNVAIIITIDENETRYDADISLHGHFKCSSCGKIYDIRLNTAGIIPDELEKFQIDESHIYFKGTCPLCLKKALS